MIDVHAPHEATHTWKDFLIHMSAICLGLLLAIGLEQSVEWLHHRHQLREARAELQNELDANQRIAQFDLKAIQQLQGQLRSDMVLLLAHRDHAKPLPPALPFHADFLAMRNAAWISNQQSGVFSLMPHAELQKDAYSFELAQAVMTCAEDWNIDLEIDKAIAGRSPDGNLSAHDTDELISAISKTQGKLVWDATLIGFGGQGDSTADQ